VDLTADERAVLRQIRDFFGEASITSYRFSMLTSRWPDSHREAYRVAFEALVKKGLLVHYPKEQMFGISSAGLRAMV
jgi:hypothetical protein